MARRTDRSGRPPANGADARECNGPLNLDQRLSYTDASEEGTMATKRKFHTAAFKAQVALAAHRGDRTVNELAGH